MNNIKIFNVYVEMESQEQCDRMKQLCLDNSLPIWEDEIAFKFFYGDGIATKDKKYFESEIDTKDFFVTAFKEQKNKVTEQQFINILKEYKK